MTDDERKRVALNYLKTLDNGGEHEGVGLFDFFAEDAQVYFPKWGIARGIAEVQQLFADVGSTFKGIQHHYDTFNYMMTGTPTFVVEGTSHGEHIDGTWEADNPAWGAGRWCDVFEVEDGKIKRLHIYLDPDYAGKDTARYPWIQNN